MASCHRATGAAGEHRAERAPVSLWRHLRAIGVLPGVGTLLVPALIVWSTEAVSLGWSLPDELVVLPVLAGAGLIGLGLLLIVRTVTLFATVGQGTLAPWDPTSRLVVRCPYRHVRNPMISGVLCALLGEAALLGSLPLLVWFAAFLAINATYLPIVEEPGLVRRFGDDYETYRSQVPRWIPRLRPWDPYRTSDD
jgi:protein-S-isoprenylcysteine O-methyltransferase Ste14